jgi:catechol 2,3-dioxygenase
MSALPAATKMGPVELTVADLGRSLDWYDEAVGLRTLGRDDGRAALGAGERELLRLVEEPGAQPAPRSTGLYHFALLLPTRADLARWLAHAGRRGVRVGASDHFVSEALYLRDPDQHGIEIYADRPRELWEGQVFERMTSLPLDLTGLLAVAGDSADEPYEGLPDGTTMGHVHLKVSDVTGAIGFYRDVLGFELTAALGDEASFFGAGGYHHHVGGNTWESAGAPPPPPGSASLRSATIELPSSEDRETVLARIEAAGQDIDQTDAGPLVRDPSGNPLILATA